MYNFLKDPNFLNAKENKDYFLFKKVLPNVPSWDDVFINLQNSIEEQSPIKTIPKFTIITHNGHTHLKLASEFLNEIKKLNPALNASAHVYIGLTKFSESFGKHKDDSDVFFWQIIGNTNWKVSSLSGLKEHVLEVGDVIYVPNNMFHEVTSLGPRVGISLGLDY